MPLKSSLSPSLNATSFCSHALESSVNSDPTFKVSKIHQKVIDKAIAKTLPKAKDSNTSTSNTPYEALHNHVIYCGTHEIDTLFITKAQEFPDSKLMTEKKRAVDKRFMEATHSTKLMHSAPLHHYLASRINRDKNVKAMDKGDVAKIINLAYEQIDLQFDQVILKKNLKMPLTAYVKALAPIIVEREFAPVILERELGILERELVILEREINQMKVVVDEDPLSLLIARELEQLFMEEKPAVQRPEASLSSSIEHKSEQWFVDEKPAVQTPEELLGFAIK